MKPARSIRTRRARRVLLGATLVFCAVFAASCRAVLGIDDYKASTDTLCELLVLCYDSSIANECNTRVAADLTGAPPSEREGWLRAFSDSSCLESCASARRCLNIVPVCDLKECQAREDCCGFLEGRADCNLLTHACCSPKGTSCSPEKDDCCPGAGACDPDTRTCGGVECKSAGQGCEVNEQCCTHVCRDNKCGEELCLDDNVQCSEHIDCCSGFCDPARGKCGLPECATEGEPCSPEGGSVCCGSLKCENGVCVLGCFPNGLECSSDEQCCDGRCDPKSASCVECSGQGTACTSPEQCCSGECDKDGKCTGCRTTGAACASAAECCSGVCEGGKCGAVCNAPDCAHNECSEGAPLKPTCSTCTELVCADDAYCCCTKWDPLCVAEAKELCKSLPTSPVCN